MKKLVGILMIMLFALVSHGQTVIKESASIQKYGRVGDTLNLNDTIADTWYVKPFSTDAELYWDIDSVSGTPSIKLDFQGSYDYSEWFVINSSTLTPAVGDTIFVQQSGTYLYPYLKVQAIAVSNAQNVRYKYVLTVKSD